MLAGYHCGDVVDITKVPSKVHKYCIYLEDIFDKYLLKRYQSTVNNSFVKLMLCWNYQSSWLLYAAVELQLSSVNMAIVFPAN